MVRLELKDGQWIERASHPHNGHGRRRRYGYTQNGERKTRSCMVKRSRPPKGRKS